MNAIKGRLLEYVDYKGISKREFCRKVGVSSTFLANDSDITMDKAIKILTAYPEVNINWLIMGMGVMIIPSDEEIHDMSKELVLDIMETQQKMTDLGYFEDASKIDNDLPVAHVDVKQKFSLRTDRTVEGQMVSLYELEASAGIAGLFIGQHQAPMEQLYIPNLTKCDGAIFVRGNSMTPLISAGDIVLFRQVNNIRDGIMWGEIYMISFNIDGDDYLAIKYIRKSEKQGYVTLASFNPDHKPQDIPIDTINKLALVKASVKYTTMM